MKNVVTDVAGGSDPQKYTNKQTPQQSVGMLLGLSVSTVFLIAAGYKPLLGAATMATTSIQFEYSTMDTNINISTSTSIVEVYSTATPSKTLSSPLPSPAPIVLVLDHDNLKPEDAAVPPPTACHFEDGNGYYEKINNETLTFNWIHNKSTYPSSSGANHSSLCNIVNHVEAIQNNQYHPSKPLTFLTFGDSLDRNTVLKYMCDEKFGLTVMSQKTNSSSSSSSSSSLSPEEQQTKINTAKSAPMSSGICTNTNNNNNNNTNNSRISFAFFKLYGMHHSCDNHEWLYKVESRPSNTTAERVEQYLDFDILSRLSNDTQYVVMASSSLWDLSTNGKGIMACNDQPGVSEEYQTLYRQGIIDLYAVIQKLLPSGAPMYWRTSPAVTVEYSNHSLKKGTGKNRPNQETLNAILKETVAEHSLGTVVDWWNQANQRPENDRSIKQGDGRHYLGPPSIAFFNMYLNAVFDHHPELLQ